MAQIVGILSVATAAAGFAGFGRWMALGIGSGLFLSGSA